MENCYVKGGSKEGQAPWAKKKDGDKGSQKADSANCYDSNVPLIHHRCPVRIHTIATVSY